MNMEAGIGSSDYTELDEGNARRRRMIIVASIMALVLVVAGVVALRVFRKPAAPVTDTAPGITVIVPGRHSVTTEIPAVGNISARRDMPVGVAGEGGTVVRVLVEPGDWVKAGQSLAVIDRSVQVQQAASLAASIRQAQADADLARSQLERARKLVSNGFVSKADIEQKEATLDSANARVAVAQAQYKQQQAMIGRLDIRSPTAGLVLTRAVEAGQTVGVQSQALFRVAEGGKMELQAHLSEADLARIHVGSPAFVTPVGTTMKVAGEVWQISPVIDTNTRQGTVRIALPFNKALRPGGFAAAEIGGGVGDVPLLPESAVLSDQKGNYVYLIGPDNRAVRREVKVGDVDDRGVSIISGLTGREQVVASAGAFLNPGDKVKPHLAPSPR
ncbi:efflux RND transporter periplasmic adaptor subunit [Sphingomonas sp. MMS24-J13]|uniref:efflux RND transporter periplasmic adaptor subunit n=1 Tax=Sphingomonas sp. MMS24-J13 TaxID=3238686 RepID=UPI00384AA3E8